MCDTRLNTNVLGGTLMRAVKRPHNRGNRPSVGRNGGNLEKSCENQKINRESVSWCQWWWFYWCTILKVMMIVLIVIVMMWQQKQCSINLVGARCGKANALIVQWRWYDGKACSDSTMVIVKWWLYMIVNVQNKYIYRCRKACSDSTMVKVKLVAIVDTMQCHVHSSHSSYLSFIQGDLLCLTHCAEIWIQMYLK